MIAVAASILFFASFIVFPRLPHHVRAFILRETPITACTLDTNAAAAETCRAAHGASRIPNIVNLVFVLKDPETGDYPIQFSHYLSIYAIYWRLKPDIIYLHTNTKPDGPAVQRAKDGATGKWSKLFFEIPGLTINEIKVPTHARNGVPITTMEHKSDFVRVQAVHDFGGIYIDLDVHTLRDLKPLIESGYGGVAGRQVDDALNSGTFMSEKGGKLISTWLDSMHTVYDGKWITHSNKALTKIGENMLRTDPCEILVLGRDAFAPVGWREEDNEWLFDEHNVSNETAEVELERYVEEHADDDTSWAHDWSCTYLLHAFNLKKPRHGFKHNGITPRIVLEQTSNFARAVYPVAKELYDKGVVAIDDEP